MKKKYSIKETEEIVKRIQNGEEDLLEDFVISYDKYIQNIISKYSFYNDREDLIQVARLHLIKSVYNYKDKVAIFMQYANFRIHTEIQRYIYTNLENILDFDDKYAFCIKAYERCRRYLGKDPDAHELSRYLCIQNCYGEEIIEIVNNLNENYRYSKIDSLIYDFDAIASSSLTKDKILSFDMSDKQRDVIINKYFSEDYSETLLAKENNVTRQAINELEQNGKRNLSRKFYIKSLVKED